MATKRTRFTAEFKGRVALEARDSVQAMRRAAQAPFQTGERMRAAAARRSAEGDRQDPQPAAGRPDAGFNVMVSPGLPDASDWPAEKPRDQLPPSVECASYPIVKGLQ